MSRLNEIKRTAKTSPLLEKGLLCLDTDVSKMNNSNVIFLKNI
jgi:hypothetical protein